MVDGSERRLNPFEIADGPSGRSAFSLHADFVQSTKEREGRLISRRSWVLWQWPTSFLFAAGGLAEGNDLARRAGLRLASHSLDCPPGSAENHSQALPHCSYQARFGPVAEQMSE
jgi:hypothetical protein